VMVGQAGALALAVVAYRNRHVWIGFRCCHICTLALEGFFPTKKYGYGASAGDVGMTRP